MTITNPFSKQLFPQHGRAGCAWLVVWLLVTLGYFFLRTRFAATTKLYVLFDPAGQAQSDRVLLGLILLTLRGVLLGFFPGLLAYRIMAFLLTKWRKKSTAR